MLLGWGELGPYCIHCLSLSPSKGQVKWPWKREWFLSAVCRGRKMMVNVVGLLINSAFLHSVKTTSLTLEENSDFYQYVFFFLLFLHPKSKRLGTVHLAFHFVYIKAPKLQLRSLRFSWWKLSNIYWSSSRMACDVLTYIIFTPKCSSNKIFYHYLQPSSYPSPLVLFKHSMCPSCLWTMLMHDVLS